MIRLDRGGGHAEQGIQSCRGVVEIDGKVKKSLIRLLVKLADGAGRKHASTVRLG
jgi:hypothetical protein